MNYFIYTSHPFLTSIHIAAFVFEFSNFALLPIDSNAGRDKLWPSTSNVVTFDQH